MLDLGRIAFSRVASTIILISTGLMLTSPPLARAAGNPCLRSAPGSVVQDAIDLFSQNGVLTVNLSYNTGTDANGLTLYCFTTPNGSESPTLHVKPGDTLIVNVINNLPAPAPSDDMKMTTSADTVCGDSTMNSASVNIHYHGTNTPPTCHADEVIHTLINSGQSFTYTVPFPNDEPPGAYWYHPHVHGLSEMAVQGGASGAIIVDGIENVQPKVAGLTQRVLIIRDQPVPDSVQMANPKLMPPGWDLSLNYVPIPFPTYPPAIIQMDAKEKQFWRVVNASADTIINLQLRYDGRVQPLQVVALDGVPIGSQDGTRTGRAQNRANIFLPPAARAEFIVHGPSAKVRKAILYTLKVNTGPAGDSDPTRPLASIQPMSNSTTASSAAPSHRVTIPQVSRGPGPQRFEGLATARVTARRTLYFSETTPPDDEEPNFFITVVGQPPRLFNPNNPPAITTTQGSVEDWTIQNRSGEAHEFHIHQIHFLTLVRDGVPLPAAQRQYLDMVHLPFWPGHGPFPSVTVRMDFRGPDIGDFVYHCHILEHEDHGMMAIIRVNPATASNKRSTTPQKAASREGVKLIKLSK